MHRSILRGLAAIALAVALVVALVPASGPATAGKKHDPLAGLTLHPEWGSVTGQGGVLKRGCRMYSYTYDIDPPEGIWALEMFISGPGLKALAAGAFMGDYDPRRAPELQAVPGDHPLRQVHDRGQGLRRRRDRQDDRGPAPGRPLPAAPPAPLRTVLRRRVRAWSPKGHFRPEDGRRCAVNQYSKGCPAASSLVVLLACLVSLALAPTATARRPDQARCRRKRPGWGSTAADERQDPQGLPGLRLQLHDQPPAGRLGPWRPSWSGRAARKYGSGYFLTGWDPLTGSGAFRLCRRATKGGKYTIRALLSVQDGLEYAEGWLPETTFRLRKPR